MALYCRGVTNWHLAQLTSAQVFQITAVPKWSCQASAINDCYCMCHPKVWNLRKWWTSHLRTRSTAPLAPEWLHSDEESWEAASMWKMTRIQNRWFQKQALSTMKHNRKKTISSYSTTFQLVTEVHQNKCQSNSLFQVSDNSNTNVLLYVCRCHPSIDPSFILGLV